MDCISSVRFTDEELLLLGAEHPVVDTPYLHALDAGARRLAVQVAYRSLCAHGAVPVDDGAGLEVPESIVTVLRARSAAQLTLLVSRATPTAGVFRYHHFAADVVVVEDVTDEGVHDLRMIEPAAVGAELRDFCTVEEAVEGRGDPVTLTEDAFAAGECAEELWGRAVAQFDATVWRSGDASGADAVAAALSVSFLLGTGGSWCGRRVPQPGESRRDRLLRLSPIAPDAVVPIVLRELVPDAQPDGLDVEWPLMRA